VRVQKQSNLTARRAGAVYVMLDGKQGAEMNLRIGFSIALVAVLFCLWILLTKPICGIGFKASFGARLGWTCVSDN